MLATSNTDADRAAAAPRTEHLALRDHLISAVAEARLERDPYCHIYMEGIFPAAMYPSLLSNFPPNELYSPLNLRRWARADGTSTRDLFYFTPENLAKAPAQTAVLWKSVLDALTDGHFKRALFARLAPDMAERFETTEDKVPDLECVHDLCLVRDTEDYRIKPHPDGLNNFVTMQFYLPEDESNLDLGTSVYRRHKRLLGSSFEEVRRFPFKPNSAYAFAVSDSPIRTSWHGRDRLQGFSGVRNTMILSFRKTSPRQYAS
jgi:hypothetical protein